MSGHADLCCDCFDRGRYRHWAPFLVSVSGGAAFARYRCDRGHTWFCVWAVNEAALDAAEVPGYEREVMW